VFEVIDQIPRVLYTDTQTDEIFWETSFGANGRGNRGVAVGQRVIERLYSDLRHEARHTDQTVDGAKRDRDTP
jgi:hypothetical protein